MTTYGVGGVVPVADEAFMVASLERWGVGEPDLHEPRLERSLGVNGFVQPPASDKRPDVPVVRFPGMQSCAVCHRLDYHSRFTHWDLNECQDCAAPLIPSRFVVACEMGHLDDFPYERWVHHGAPGDGSHNLRLSSSGATASLASITVECSCGASRTMEDAFDQFALQDVARCTGRHPWRAFVGEGCDQTPRTLQRGGSSVWFGVTRSALSIPPWSEAASRALDSHWATLRHLSIESLPDILRSMKMPERTGFSVEELVQIAGARHRRDQGTDPGEDLRAEEFEALCRGRVESAKDIDFATRAAEVPAPLRRWIDQVQLVTRLREVRALTGFSRVHPPRGIEGNQDNIVSIREEGITWLPGIEVRGEGLFIRLEEEALAEWAEKGPVRERVAIIEGRNRDLHDRWGIAPSREVSAGFMLLHVLAHALINQLALDAGYPAGSLRERIYTDPGNHGVLIYTATTDSAGSLGGLIAQGEPRQFEALVVDSISRFAWCSADPVCIESTASGVDSLNLAACHCCALLPETSCEEMNMFLDRAFLVGTPASPEIGFFAELLN